mmetsp:Transcript_49554/g.117614  ORF Transcript_49554/g.117614 Transcript_49554/m.117614 type:complete len:321 (+) Transcript_49554:14-976(+)
MFYYYQEYLKEKEKKYYRKLLKNRAYDINWYRRSNFAWTADKIESADRVETTLDSTKKKLRSFSLEEVYGFIMSKKNALFEHLQVFKPKIDEYKNYLNWTTLLNLLTGVIGVVYETIFVTMKDICCSILGLVFGDQADNLELLLPHINSEYNHRTIPRLILQYFFAKLTYQFYNKISTQINNGNLKTYRTRHGKDPRCPNWNIGCDYLHMKVRECFYSSLLEIFIFFFTCLRGYNLKNRNHFKINVFLCTLSVIQARKWRLLWNEIGDEIKIKGGYRICKSKNVRIIWLFERAISNCFLASTLAYLSFLDVKRKWRGWIN